MRGQRREGNSQAAQQKNPADKHFLGNWQVQLPNCDSVSALCGVRYFEGWEGGISGGLFACHKTYLWALEPTGWPHQ
jgi:hypothetical protein